MQNIRLAPQTTTVATTANVDVVESLCFLFAEDVVWKEFGKLSQECDNEWHQIAVHDFFTEWKS